MIIKRLIQRMGRRRQLWLFSCVLLLLATAPVLFVLSLQVLPLDNAAWDWANGIGLSAWLILLLLFYYNARPRSLPSLSGRFFFNLHRELAFALCALLLLHILHQLLREPVLWQHFSTAAPPDMLAAWLAALLLLVLLVSSLSGLRARLWGDYARFRFWHRWLSLLALAGSAWHILALQVYLYMPFSIAVFCVSLLCALYWFFLRDYFLHNNKQSKQLPRLRARNTDAGHVVALSTLGCVLLLAAAYYALGQQG